MPLGPFDPIPPRSKNYRSHINELREALTGVQDAYDVAVADGFTGTRGQWLASLKGDKGDTGPPLDLQPAVDTVGDLPMSGNPENAIRIVKADSHAYQWTGTGWDDLGPFQGPGGEDPRVQALTEGQIVQGGLGGGPQRVKHRAHTAITVASIDSPAWMRAIADYVCDGTADNVEWQAAIDEAEASRNTNGIGAPDVHLLPGRYYLAATVIWKTARLLGAAGQRYGIRVYWTGATGGGPAIVRTGPNSTGEMANIGFRGDNMETASNGGTYPGTWLDLTNSPIDHGFRLHDLYFSGGVDQIKLAGWWNLQWSDLRFDNWLGYAISFAPHAGQNFSDGLIERVTMDRSASPSGIAGSAKAVIGVDLTAANTAVGTIVLRHGRIEIGHALSERAIYHAYGSVTPPARAVSLGLEWIEYTDIVGMADDVAIRLDFPSTGAVNYSFKDFMPSGMSTLFGGSWVTQQPAIPATHYALISGNNGTSNQADIVASHFTARPLGFSGEVGYSLRYPGDTNNRWHVVNNGQHVWGSGFAAGDTTLYRSGAGVLRTDGALRVQAVATGSRPTAASVGAGGMVFDSTLNKPIWSDGTNWRDAAGTVV